MTLISVDQLRARLASETDYVLVDVRYSLTDHAAGRRAYDEGHLPGAVFMDLHDDLADASRPGGRHPLPSTDAFAEVLGRAGISSDTWVVAYDAAGGALAARLWWMLRAVGHTDVAVLDGGFPTWLSAGGPVTTDVPERSAATYAVPPTWAGVVDADGVVAALAQSRTVVDCRAPERFRGEVEPLDPRAGHIPGAINVFQGANLGPDGRHRPLEELRERFTFLDRAERPVFYCGSGVSACHNLLMLQYLGHPAAQTAVLYAGSWSDWCSDPSRAVATGDI